MNISINSHTPIHRSTDEFPWKDVDFNLRRIYNLFEKHCYKLKVLFLPRNEKSPFAPLQVHNFCNRADKVWGKCISVSLCLKQQCLQPSQIQLFVKQYLMLLTNRGITIKDPVFSVFKTAHRKYISLKAVRCLSLSSKAQHGNFVIYFFTSFIHYRLFLNPLSLSLENTIFFFFFVEYLQRIRNILHFSI